MTDDRYTPPNSTLSSSREKTRAWQRSGNPIARNTPLRPVNPERKAKRESEDKVYGTYHRFVGTLPCILEGRHECAPYDDGDRVKGHHLVPVSRGGEDYGNEVPTCLRCHVEIHGSPSRFEDRWDVDLEGLAGGVERLWEAR